MSTRSGRTAMRRRSHRINGAVVAVGIVMGLVYLAVGLASDELAGGLIGLGVMLALVTALAIGSRYSDTIALLADDVHEERHVHVHRRAALFTLNILALVIVVAAVVDVARGGSGAPYTWLAAFAGVTYVGAVLALARRT
jgi:uncharacterized membrane protein